MVRPERCYLVCANARSGSTMLCRTLSDLGTAGRPEEYFLTWPEPLPGEDGYWEHGRLARKYGVTSREDFLALVYRRGTTPNGVFGAKLLWRYVPLVLANFQEMPHFSGMSDAEDPRWGRDAGAARRGEKAWRSLYAGRSMRRGPSASPRA